jgi:Na+/phosphate symporter
VNEVDPVIFYDLLLWAEKGKTPLQQMTPQQRQVVFAALATIVVLGIVMILLVSASARMVRRYVQQSSDRSPSINPLARDDDWAKKPLIDIDGVSDDE